MNPGRRGHLPWLGVLAVIAGYTAIRLMLIPDAGQRTFAFTHDSAYLVIVAESLMAGAGFVNPAHWLVFLHPETLPVPFHQANPLMPILMAGLSLILPIEPVTAGFAISAVGSGLLVLGLVLLLSPYLASPWKALAVALFVTLFPLIFEDSLRLLADSMYLALVALFAAAIGRTGQRPDTVRGPSLRRLPEPLILVLAGVLLGLAWLTRSQAILLLPVLVLFLMLRGGIVPGLARFTVIVAAAALVATPWLIRQQLVWGDPLYSEAGYYLVQDLVASREFGGEVERYWHSTDPPPGVVEALLADPRGSLAFFAEGIPAMLRRYLRALGLGSRFTLLLFAVVAGGFLLTLTRRGWNRLWSPELVTGAVLAFVTLAAFGLRPHSAEVRYFGVVTVGFCLVAALGGVKAWDWAVRTRGRYRTAVLTATALLLVGLWGWRVLPGVLSTHAYVTQPDPLMTGYRQLARVVDEGFAHGGPVVVGMKPYFYTLATGAPALSIPQSGDGFLMEFMDRYGACFILLKDFELRYWRPSWERQTPDWLVGVAEFPDDGVPVSNGNGITSASGWHGTEVPIPRAVLLRREGCMPEPG